MNPTIAIDGNNANVTEPVGVSVYTFQLLWHFKKIANTKRRFIIYLRHAPLPHLPKENEFFQYRIVWGPVAWLRIFLPRQLKRDAKQLGEQTNVVFFSPAHYVPGGLPTGWKLVVTIHDLAYLYFPEEFLKKDLHKLTRWTQVAVTKANAVIAVSQNTKHDIEKNYHTPSDKIHVVSNGFDAPKSQKQGYYKERYLLMLGTLQPRKNHMTVLHAFAKLILIYPDLKLRIAGKQGWMYTEILEEVKKLGITSSVQFLGSVDDNKKEKLYANALCFLMPSLYEGFGIPVLEAMAAGCPVICSGTSSLPEVAGNAAILLTNPQNPDEVVEKVTQIIDDPRLRSRLAQSGKLRAKKFSWDKCAEETYSVLTRV